MKKKTTQQDVTRALKFFGVVLIFLILLISTFSAFMELTSNTSFDVIIFYAVIMIIIINKLFDWLEFFSK